MLKNVKYFILFLYIFIFICFANADDFENITAMDSDNKDLVIKNFDDLAYNDYIFYFSLVSMEKQNFSEYFKWFKNIENRIDSELASAFGETNISNLTKENQKEFADKLLSLIHETALKKYYIYADRFSDVMQKGEYNCVSSSILYSIFLKKYGFNYMAVETQDHVFIKVILKDESIDVETTTKFGFDPGKKKNVLDDFGKLTGFSYVPQKDYHGRKDINFKKLLLLVYHNLANFYEKKNDYVTSSKLAYVVYKGRDDAKGKEDFFTFCHNYIVYLVNQKDYIRALALDNSYLQKIEFNLTLFNMRFDILLNYINAWKDYSSFENAKNILISENEKYKTFINDPRFVKIYFYLYLKYIEYFIFKNDYASSYKLIKEFNEKYTYPESEKLFENVLLDDIQHINKNESQKEIEDKFIKLKTDFTEYSKIIYKHETNYYIIKINNQLKSNDYATALSNAKILYKKQADHYDVRNLLLSCYVNYTIFYYNKKDINNVIILSEEGLKTFPGEKTLTSNYASFLKNFTNEEINKKDYAQARKILNIAKEKFSSDSYLKQLDTYLISLGY